MPNDVVMSETVFALAVVKKESLGLPAFKIWSPTENFGVPYNIVRLLTFDILCLVTEIGLIFRN